MADIQWGQIALTASISLIGGGAMGAFINNYFAWRRSRIQPVHYRIGTDLKTGSIGPQNEYILKMSVRHGIENYEYPRLAVVNIYLANAGVGDYGEFPFGLTLTKGDRAILCEVEGPDRHNDIEVVTSPTPGHPRSTVDFICKPFNRDKSYQITLYVEPADGAAAIGEIKPSSPIGIEFVNTHSFVQFSPEQVDYVFKSVLGSIPVIGLPYYEMIKLLRSRGWSR